MLTTEQLAHHHSMTCFFNSLFLEWHGNKRDGMMFIIPLLKDETLLLPLKYFSLTGRHHYGETLYLQTKSEKKEIDFSTAIKKVADSLAQEFNTPEDQKKNFVERVFNSTQNIKDALSSRQDDITSLYESEVDFNSAEQGLFIGHTFHPTPKSRSEFSDSDYKKYSPEMAGHFPLEWVLLSQDIFFQKLSNNFTQKFWTEEAYLADFDNQTSAREKLKDGFIPFPLHPWQKQFIDNDPTIIEYKRAGKIISLGSGEKQWHPTSSLRTLYSPTSDYMLKFSMNVRLTNSIRHLLVHELDRGLQVHDVMSHPEGQKFTSTHPEFEVIYEPAYAGIKGMDGAPLQETLIVGRFNPFKKPSEAIVLATLTQDHPEMKLNLVQTHIQKFSEKRNISLKMASELWFNEFLQICLKPLLIAQANYGILLGSHQQNMIVELKDHLPVKSYFRDCNGTGYSQLGHKLFAKEVTSLDIENGNILEDEIAGYLFGYYVIINSTFNMISSIAHSTWISEEELLHDLRSFLLAMKSDKPKDLSFIDYLLDRKTLMHKGNFLCSFRNINENTTKNPLSIYTEIPNPLHERAH